MQDEFVTVEEMIERIKDVICHTYTGKVFDQDVADVLDMGKLTLATAKKRNSPPLKYILRFCKRVGLDPMKILF